MPVRGGISALLGCAQFQKTTEELAAVHRVGTQQLAGHTLGMELNCENGKVFMLDGLGEAGFHPCGGTKAGADAANRLMMVAVGGNYLV